MKRRSTSAIIFPLLDKKESTGQSRSAFCQEYGMSKSVYYYWHTRWRKAGAKKSSKPAMVPLNVEGLTQEQPSIVIEHKGHTKIHLPVKLLVHFPAIMRVLCDAG